MSQIYTCSLADPQSTLETVGGKGASLARLSRAGLPVPDSFQITTEAYRQFVTACGLQEQILMAVSAANPDQPAVLEEASGRIGRLFAQGVIPDEIAKAIRQAYANLGGEDLPVAVRSSATAEDQPGMSFAGQMETYLNMQGETMVLDAVKRCWASLWTARAIGYRARNGITPKQVSQAVVVQELVPAEAAGVMFTADALTGRRDRLAINAAWGLGEAVVGGQVTPDTYKVDKYIGKVVEQQISRKETMLVRTQAGTYEQPVPEDLRSRTVLKKGQAVKLARLGMKIEELYGQPMDIEWAFENGRFFILQARPITSLHGHDPMNGEANKRTASNAACPIPTSSNSVTGMQAVMVCWPASRCTSL